MSGAPDPTLSPDLDEPTGSGQLSVWLWPAVGVTTTAIAGALAGPLATGGVLGIFVAVAAGTILKVGLPTSWTRAAGAIGLLVGLVVLGVSVLIIDWRGSTAEPLPGFDARDTLVVAQDFSGATLSQVTVDSTELRGAALVGATLASLDLRGADLSGARASGIDLHNADLTGATLAGADLRGADLRGACLDRTDFSGADLTGVDASGASLRRTVISDEQVTTAAIWPTGEGAPAPSCH